MCIMYAHVYRVCMYVCMYVNKDLAAPAGAVFSPWKVWGVGLLFLSCACVSVLGVLFSVGVYVCDLMIFLQG